MTPGSLPGAGSGEGPAGLRVVIGGLPVGGTEKHLLLVLPRLRRLGWEPRVLALTRGGPLLEPLVAAGVPVTVLASRYWRALRDPRLRRAVGTPQVVAALARDFRRSAFEATWALLPQAYVLAGLAAFLARTGAPLIMSRRSLGTYRTHAPLIARAEVWLQPRTDAFLANSDAVAADLRAEGVPAERLHVVRNGIDLSQFPARVTRRDMRERLGLARDALVLACVASLIRYKGHLDLLNAVSLLEREGKQVTLLCAGDGPERSALMEEARRLGIAPRVRWLGTRTDIPEILHASDIGVLASHEEGSPNAVLEYMAAGLPVVATAVGGSGESIVDGVTGHLVPARAPERLARALARLLDDPAQRAALGRQGRRRALREFDIDTCVARYSCVFSSVLRQSRRPALMNAHGRTGRLRDV